MKKINLTQTQILLIGLVGFIGTMLGIFTLTGAGESIRKLLGALLISLIAMLGGTFLAQTQETMPTALEAESNIHLVTNITDGDTIEIDYSAKVRLLGIDAPEHGECFYQESKAALQALIQEQYVRLDKDAEAVDSFGRLLRYVILQEPDPFKDNTLVNDYMIRYGFAKVKIVSPNKRYSDIFNGSQQQAKETGQGLWTACADELAELRTGDLPADPNCAIKGNISLKEYGKTYFTSDCPNYNQVKIEFSKQEQYFCTEQQALDAGFTKATTCP